MDRQEAELLAGFIATVLVPFVVSFIKRVTWPDWAKLALAVGLSLVAGALTAYATGGFLALASGRYITVALGIFAAATTFYHTAFKGLGLEDWLNPPPARTSRVYEVPPIIGTPRGN